MRDRCRVAAANGDNAMPDEWQEARNGSAGRLAEGNAGRQFAGDAAPNNTVLKAFPDQAVTMDAFVGR